MYTARTMKTQLTATAYIPKFYDEGIALKNVIRLINFERNFYPSIRLPA